MCASVDEFPDCWTESLWSWCGEEPTCDSYGGRILGAGGRRLLVIHTAHHGACSHRLRNVYAVLWRVNGSTLAFVLSLKASFLCLLRLPSVCVHVWAETDLVPVGRCWSGTPGRLNRTTHSECGQWRTATTQCGHTAFHHQRAVKDNSRTRLCPALGIPLCQEDCLYATSNYLGRPSFLETDKAHYTIPDNIW